MTKTIKKSVSILLSIIMILSVFTIIPMSASAAGNVAEVNGVEYATFADAVAASHAADEAVITPLVNLNELDQPVYTMSAGETLKVKYVAGLNAYPAAPAGYHVNAPYAYDSTLGAYVFTCTVAEDVVKIARTSLNATTGDYFDYYTQLQSNKSGTQIVCRDFTQSTRLTFSKAYPVINAVIDLGGHTVTFDQAASDADSIYGHYNANITIQNGTIVFTTDDGFYLDNANLTVADDATLSGTGSNSPIVVKGDSTVDVEGTVEAEDSFAIAGNGNAGNGGYTINIKDGAEVSSENGIAIYHPNEGDLNISGGEISGKTAVYVKSGNTTITGGTFTANGAAASVGTGSGATPTGEAIVVDNAGYDGGAPTVSISAGTFESENAAAVGSYASGTDATTNEPNEPVTDIITGGTFSGVAAMDEDIVADNATITNTVYTAKINDTLYETLAAAVAAVQNGDTIVLLADQSVDLQVAAGEAFTIDLNSHTMTVTSSQNYNYIRGDLTIEDNSTAKNGAVIVSSYGIVPRGDDGKVTVNNGSFTTAPGKDYIFYLMGGTLEVNGGSFTANHPVNCYASGNKAYGGTVVINDGTFESTGYFVISGFENSDITINDGEFTGPYPVYVDKRSNVTSDYEPASATIKGGTFTATEKDEYGSTIVDCENGASVTIEGGTFEDGDIYVDNNSDLAVSGGTFDRAVPEEYCADGFIPVENSNGTFGVDGPYAAKINDTLYETIQAAIDNASAGDTITVISDVDFGQVASKTTSVIVDNKTVIIDLNGYTVKGEYDFAQVILVKNGGQLTINDSSADKTGKIIGNRYERSAYAVKVNADSKLTVNGGTLQGYSQAIYISGGEVEINGGTVQSDLSRTADAIAFNGAGTLTINDGHVIGSNYAIFTSDAGLCTVTITGGTIETTHATKGVLTVCNNDAITVTGGDFNGNYIAEARCTNSGSVLALEGGDFTDCDKLLKGGNYSNTFQYLGTSISGGTYSVDPSAQVTDGSYTYTPTIAAGYESVTEANANGMYTVTESDEFAIHHSISLEGDVKLNYYLNPLKVAAGDEVTFTRTVNDKVKSSTYTLTDGDLTDDGYIVSVDVPAAEMTYDITATVVKGGDTLTDIFSVRDYCDVILDADSAFSVKYKANNGTARYNKLVALVQSMLDYGSMAQLAFGRNTDDLANGGTNYNDISSVGTAMIDSAITAANGDCTPVEFSTIADAVQANYFTTTVTFLDKSTLRIYFTPYEYGQTISYADDYTDNQAGYYYYVEKQNIAAADLDQRYEFTIGECTFSYSVLDYAKAILTGSSSTEAQNLARATVLYNKAANEFFV